MDRDMPKRSLAFVLGTVLSALLALSSAAPARAGDDAAGRIADLEHELLVARVQRDLWAERTKGLYRLAESLLDELNGAARRHDEESERLRREIAARDGDLRTAERLRDRARKAALAHQQRIATLEAAAEARRRDLEQLQWHLHLAAPSGSMRKADSRR